MHQAKFQSEFMERTMGFVFVTLNDYNDRVCTGNEPALLSSAAGLKQSGLTIPPLSHISLLNNEKYINKRSNFLPLVRKLRMSCKSSSIDCITIAQIR